MINGNTNFGNYNNMYKYVNYSKLYYEKNDFEVKRDEKIDFTPRPTKTRSWIA